MTGHNRITRSSGLIVLLLIVSGCATYYQQTVAFQGQVGNREWDKALHSLDKNKTLQRNKNRLLYYLEKGTVFQLNQQYDSSNASFENAYIFLDDYQKKLGEEALTFVLNPGVRTYPGEDFEGVLLHYYKAINYLMLDDHEASLIECRRVNIKLNELNDRYKNKNRYNRDAFAHNIMGMVYEADGDYNNAFIAYRNALEIYESDYKKHFGLPAPLQLKKDILRSAYKTGFREELYFYERKFGMEHDPSLDSLDKTLIYFWHNGLVPVKDEWSIMFTIIKGQGGYVTFVNDELGLNFGFRTRNNDEYASLGDLKVVRVAFPKYVIRGLVNQRADIRVGENSYPLQLAENVGQIATKTLRDRMMRELANTLLRIAVKQAMEAATREGNEGLGAVMSVVNAASEKADTRNWQTLPFHISYARIPISDRDSVAKLITYSKSGSRMVSEEKLDFGRKKTLFMFHHSVEHRPASLTSFQN